jgi:hypothetical protein
LEGAVCDASPETVVRQALLSPELNGPVALWVWQIFRESGREAELRVPVTLPSSALLQRF